jgi:hypothetical protein
MIVGKRLRRARVLTLALLAVVLGSAVGAAAASGATVYATPSPDATHDCTQAHPCAIEQAVAASPGSEVIILPGTYSVSNILFAGNTVDIHGVDGQPRPRVVSTYGFAALELFGDNATLRHLEIETTGSSGVALDKGGQVMQDVIATATGAAASGCSPIAVSGTVTIRNSICRGTNRGIGTNCNGCHETVSLRNVTAIGDTYGIAFEESTGSTSTYTINATNVIARALSGGGTDVRAEAGDTNSSAEINLDHSNYASRQAVTCGTPPCPATITDPATASNQTAAPLFVNAPGGDFHQAAGSPTIDAGINDPLNGTTDIDGEARQIGPLTDIGADERPPDAGGGGAASPPPPTLVKKKKCKRKKHRAAESAKKKCKKRRK